MEYDVIEFKNGYGANVPTMIVEFKGRCLGTGNANWGAQPGCVYHTLKLGEVLSLHNAEVSHGDRERQPDTHSTHNQP